MSNIMDLVRGAIVTGVGKKVTAAQLKPVTKVTKVDPKLLTSYQTLGKALTTSGVKNLAGGVAPFPTLTGSYPSQNNGYLGNGTGIIGPAYGRAPVPGAATLPATGDTGVGVRTTDTESVIRDILAGGSGASVSDPTKPTLRSGEDMAKQLGVNYNLDFITQLLTDAAIKKSENLDLDAAKAQNAFYKSMSDNANLLATQAMRGDRAAAINGMSEAGRAASELSLMLGSGAESAKGATQLAVDRALLKAKAEADVADAKAKGLDTYNNLGVELGRVGASELNAGMVGYNGELSLAGSRYGADSAIKQALIALQGQKYAADRGVAAAAAGKSSSYSNTPAEVSDYEKAQQGLANALEVRNDPNSTAAQKAAADKLINGYYKVIEEQKKIIVPKPIGKLIDTNLSTGPNNR